MKKTRWYATILSVVMLITLIPFHAEAADKVIEVGTAAEVRTALQNDAGAHIKLKNNISFTNAGAQGMDSGVLMGEGCYTVDLNGFTLKYHHRTEREFSDGGTPIHTDRARLAVINGPGTLIGGTHGIEHGNQFGSLVLNGVTVRGIMGHGIRFMGGIIYINGGDVAGNFGSMDHEGGIIVLNGGKVGKISNTVRGQHRANTKAIIRDGVFTGYAELDDIILSVDKLGIAPGSSVKIIRSGGLIVKDGFVNDGTLIHESGLLSIGGKASVAGDGSAPIVFTDTDFESLELQKGAAFRIENGATVTVKGAFSSEEYSRIEAVDGELRLLGSIDHRGRAVGVPVLGEEGDIRPPDGSGASPGGGLSPADAATRLQELGLFRGVGKNPDGSTNFDLGRAPSRVEALVMLIRLLGKDEEALGGGWEHNFTDVPAWADKYVGYAREKGLTKGISATEFGTGTASVQMYLTFVLRALGYSDTDGVDFTWDKPERLAQGIGALPHGVNMEKFLRADVVLVSSVALEAKLKNSDKTLYQKLEEEGVFGGR